MTSSTAEATFHVAMGIGPSMTLVFSTAGGATFDTVPT